MTVVELIRALEEMPDHLEVHSGEEYDMCNHFEITSVGHFKAGESMGPNGAITAKVDCVFIT